MFEWRLSDLDTFNDNTESTFRHNVKFYKSKLSNNLSFFIDGYILPRKHIFLKYGHLSQEELLDMLYYEHSLEFIKYLKGAFIIIIFRDKSSMFLMIVIALRSFLFIKRNKFIISSSLLNISKSVKLRLNKENVALYCLFEHFVQGITLFDKVEYSQPVIILSFDGSLNIQQYWSPLELLNHDLEDHSYEFYSDFWKELINQYLDYLKPEEISITLTGGNDSRMILAALLNIGAPPNAFTFGNPYSNDGIVAKKIAESVGLNYHNYFVNNPHQRMVLRLWTKDYSTG